MRMTASHYRIRVRRFLRLPLPVCNYADGIGSNRPPRSTSNVAHPTHDMYGDFTLSDFRAVGQAQWLELHEEIKHFFFRAAKQAGVTSVTTEKRADLATSENPRSAAASASAPESEPASATASSTPSAFTANV